MVTVHRLDGLDRSESAGVVNRLATLGRLEFELGVAETRQTLVSAFAAATSVTPSGPPKRLRPSARTGDGSEPS